MRNLQVNSYYFADHYQAKIKYIFKTSKPQQPRHNIPIYSIISIRVYKLRYMRAIHRCHCNCSVFSRHYSSDNTRECIMYCTRIWYNNNTTVARGWTTKWPKKKTFLNGRQKTHIYAKMSVYYIKITYTFREWIKQTVYHIIIHIYYRITYNTINISIYVCLGPSFIPFVFYTGYFLRFGSVLGCPLWITLGRFLLLFSFLSFSFFLNIESCEHILQDSKSLKKDDRLDLYIIHFSFLYGVLKLKKNRITL